MTAASVLDPTDSPDEPSRPRPFSLVVVALAMTGLGLIEANLAENTLALVRAATPSTPISFETAVQYAFWSAVQTRRSGFIAMEVARLLMAGFLFVSGMRVLVRARASGWMWRQALAGNVAVTVFAVWYERALLPAWQSAFSRAAAMVTPVIPSPVKGVTLDEVFRRSAQVSVWATGLLALMFASGLHYAMRPATRDATS